VLVQKEQKMSRNGNGTYNLPAGNPVVSGTTISSTWANTTLSDIASALTGSIASDGQTPMSGTLNMTDNLIINVAAPITNTDAANKTYVDTGIAAAVATVEAEIAALGTMSTQNANNVAITGGTISGVAITGGTIASLSSALAVASGGTGVTTSTGSGANVLGTSPTISSPSISGAVMSSMASSVVTRGTAQASTSGTSITFTGIPSWAKRVTVMFQGVQRSGSSTPTIRLGTSGGIVSSGYSVGSANGAGVNYYTNGFTCNSGNSGDIFNGQLVFTNLTSNVWSGSGNLGGSTFCFVYGGSIDLGAVLTQLSITTVGGSDTFTAGNINILYE